MSPRIVRRRTEAAYQTSRRCVRVVDLTRSSPLPPEELARYAAMDRIDEAIEMSELAAYGSAMRGQFHDHRSAWRVR
jgi:hypothetical protein